MSCSQAGWQSAGTNWPVRQTVYIDELPAVSSAVSQALEAAQTRIASPPFTADRSSRASQPKIFSESELVFRQVSGHLSDRLIDSRLIRHKCLSTGEAQCMHA